MILSDGAILVFPISKGKALSDMTLSKLEKALAHTIKNKAEAAYDRSNLIKRNQDMMEQWADYLAQ